MSPENYYKKILTLVIFGHKVSWLKLFERYKLSSFYFNLKAMVQTITQVLVDVSEIIGKMYYGFVKELPWFDRFIGMSFLYSSLFLVYLGLKKLRYKC